ncbi:MAG TPA: acyltransferase [Magnetospirillaceae bacterium]
MEGLDALRGFAGLSVLAYHFLREYGLTFHDGDYQAWMDRYGHYGVEIFFIVSGFVMYLTLSRSPSLRHFVAARITRLAPAFYCCLAITTLLLVLHPLADLPGPTLPKLAANLTMAPELFGQDAMDWSYWTLGYEFVFYAMIGAVFLCGAMARIDGFCLAWLLMSAALQLALPYIPHRFGELLLIGYGQFFIIGIALCRFHRGGATRLTGTVLALAVATSLFGCSWRAPTPGLLYTGVTLLLTLLAWVAISDRIPRAIRTPLSWVATVSFPLFLIHQFLGYHIIAALRNDGLTLPASIAIATACSITLAVMIYRFVELPMRPRLKRWLTPAPKPMIAPDPAMLSTAELQD